MKIAFIDWSVDPAKPGVSGLSDLTWAMARRFARHGDDVHVFGPYTVNIEADGVTVHRFTIPPMGYRNVVGNMLLIRQALSCMRGFGSWDIVHAPEYLATALASILLQGTPIVLTVPGNIYERLHHVNHLDFTTTQVYKAAARITARYCSAIIATSSEQAQWWAYCGANPDRIFTIPLGVDTDLFHSRAMNERSPNSAPRLVFVGRLQSENGAALALHAFKYVRQAIPEATFSIVGDGPDRRSLVELAENLSLSNAIEWISRVPFEDLPSVYHSADVLLFPRLSHVTPRVLMEAMACGLPVVASAIGGITDFIVNGETGYVVNPHDVKGIAQRAVDIISDRSHAQYIGNQACSYATRYLDWDVITARIRQEVYMPLVENAHDLLMTGASI